MFKKLYVLYDIITLIEVDNAGVVKITTNQNDLLKRWNHGKGN